MNRITFNWQLQSELFEKGSMGEMRPCISFYLYSFGLGVIPGSAPGSVFRIHSWQVREDHMGMPGIKPEPVMCKGNAL